MVRKNQMMQSLVNEEEFEQPVRTESIVPPVVPIVSVKKVNGMTGDVVLRSLKVGDKSYNGESAVTIEMNDLVPGGAVVVYKGAAEEAEMPRPTEFKSGDLYYNVTSEEFWYGAGGGTVKKIPTKEFVARFALGTEAGKKIVTELNESNYVLTTKLLNRDDQIISVSEVDLPLEEIIVNITYDSATQELVFIMKSGNVIRTKISDLVKNFQEKITTTNKLAFNLVDGLETFKSTTEAAISTLTSDLNTEKTRSINKDNELQSSIETEHSGWLAGDNAEKTLREQADLAEKNARELADVSLANKIDTNTSAINTEKAAREQAVTAVDNKISAEETRAKGVEGEHSATIAGHTTDINTLKDTTVPAIQQSIVDESTARTSADSELNTRLTQIETKNLDTRLAAVESGYPDADAAIKTEFRGADTTLQLNIDKVERDYKLADAQLTTDFTAADNIVRNEFKAADNLIKDRVKNIEDADFATQISNETSARITADNTLSNRIKTFEDADLVNKVADIDNKYKAEDARLAGLISNNTTAITAEKTTREADVATLTSNLNTEITNRVNAVATVTTNLTNEVNDRKQSDIALEGKINQEATNRYEAVKSEAETREAKDTALDTKINNTKAALEAADQTIISNYTAADEALGTRIDAIHVPVYTMVKQPDSGDYAAVYRLTKDGVNEGAAINIPKDQMLKDVKTGTCVTENVPVGFHVGEHYIELTFETASGEQKRYIKVEDVIKPYTGSDSITISSENVISLNATIKTKIDTTATNLVTETTERQAADSALNVVIGSEISRATTSEANLQDQIDDLKTDLASEVTRSTTIDTNLQGRMTTAESNITQLGSDLNTEITNRTNADTTLQTNITTVKSEALAAVAQEVTDRNTAITTAINALDANLSVDAGKVITSIVQVDGKITEVNADTLTIAKVDQLQSELTSLSNRIKVFEDLKLSFTDITIGE